jgi:hypothetical protein
MDDDARLKYLFFIGCAISPLSILGSALTLITLHRTKKGTGTSASGGNNGSGSGNNNKPQTKTFHRLMMGISISDIIFATGLTLGPLPMPKEMGLQWAHGNTATCTMQGFFLQLGAASIAYSFMLMVYFVLVIRYNMREATIATRIEPFMHLVPLLFFGGSAFAGLALDVFNPAGVFCWLGVWPMGCDEEPDVVGECERGGDYIHVFGNWFAVVPYIVLTFGIIMALLIVAFTVVNRYRQGNRFVFAGSRNNNNNIQSPAAKRTQQVIVQCSLYGISFANTLIWTTLVGNVFSWLGKENDVMGKHFWLSAVSLFFFNSQGFFNFIIFIRPRYLRKRKDFPLARPWHAIYMAVWNVTISEFQQTSSTNHNIRISNSGASSNNNNKASTSNKIPSSSPRLWFAASSLRGSSGPLSREMSQEGAPPPQSGSITLDANASSEIAKYPAHWFADPLAGKQQATTTATTFTTPLPTPPTPEEEVLKSQEAPGEMAPEHEVSSQEATRAMAPEQEVLPQQEAEIETVPEQEVPP